MTDVMHRDMNFILAFMTVYGYHAMVVVFVSPSFENDPASFFTAALEPASTIGVGLMHQMSIWHRFRKRYRIRVGVDSYFRFVGAWIKKVYEPVLMSCFCPAKKNTPLSWPIYHDYVKVDPETGREDEAPDGRGSSSSVPEYRRTKLQYDIIKFIAQIIGYGMFMGIIPFLRFGTNAKNYPFSDAGALTSALPRRFLIFSCRERHFKIGRSELVGQ